MKISSFKLKLMELSISQKSSYHTENNDWIVKGFIDIHKNIYTISVDTKVVSKLIELMLYPVIALFARENNLQMIFAKHQNHYPDITFIDNSTNNKIAVDIKTTYRTDDNTVKGFTLGSFTGYFRNRKSLKNTTFTYDEYDAHLVLGVIYSKNENIED